MVLLLVLLGDGVGRGGDHTLLLGDQLREGDKGRRREGGHEKEAHKLGDLKGNEGSSRLSG